MSSTVEEPDLFNDVEIMEVGDFPESDENYVSVELCSDDDEDDCVLLDGVKFSSPKALLSDDFECTDRTVAESSYTTHRFVSDHEYLDDSSCRRGRTPVPSAEIASDRLTIKVVHSNEMFSVPYVEDLGMQDLFNKDNGADGTVNGSIEQDDEEHHQSYEYFETKIEIGEPHIQETILDEEYIGNEFISQPSAEEYDSQDEVLQSLNSSRLQNDMGSAKRSPLENDHSYTTINIITPQPSDQEDASSDEGENKIKKLVNLSKKLEREGDVTSMGGKRTVRRIDKVVKTFLNRSAQREPPASLLEKKSSSEDCLSVQLSADCSEQMEGEEILPSTDGSIAISNGRREDSASDVEGVKSNASIGSSADDIELEELIALGTKFSDHYQSWMKNKNVRLEKGSKAAQLVHLIEKINHMNHDGKIASIRQDSLNATSSGRKVETAVQTERSKDRKLRQEHRNEQCKKMLLDSSSDSSSSSSSSNSSHLSDKGFVKSSDSEMMQDFVRHNRRKRKGAKEKRKAGSADERTGKKQPPGNSEKRREQIYSDSSSDEEKGSEDGVRADGDENLLDGVLSGVDDIMSDVHDIIPDAMGVVQDYLDGAEQGQKCEERSEETNKRSSEEQRRKVGSGIESSKPASSKSIKDMTPTERDEYEDMQIERLCNISSLIGCRNASGAVGSSGTASVVKSKDAKESSKKKKDENNMEHFLNHENGSDTTVPLEPHSDESSESEKDVVETEEQFLQKCNENMKQQLLNQLSSSEITSEDENLDSLSTEDTGADSKQNGSGNEDSDESSGSLVESFLKRQDTKLMERNERKKQAMQEVNEKDNGDIVTNGQADNSGDEELIAAEDSRQQEKLGELGSEEPETPRKHNRIELANPKDKELFSNDLFDEEKSDKLDKVPRKRRKRKNARKASGSDSDIVSSSDDSDVELVDGMPKKRQRKRKTPPTLETFDFSASLNASAVPRKGKTSTGTEDDASVSNANAKQSPSTGTGGMLSKTSSPAPHLDPTTGSTTPNAAGKQKGPKEGQDCISLSSDSSDDAELISGDLDENKMVPDKEPKRRIRAMLTNDELAEETKKAQKEEEGRAARLKKKHDQLKKFLSTYKPSPGESELVLDYDSVRKQAICVHPDIVKLLKPHQIEGIKFMYDNTYGSVDALPKHSGSGCILAHCMGLGKTLQMISLLHTVMRYPQLMTNRVLVICPKSTVMNWKEEIVRWQGTIKTGYQMKVYCFPDVCTQNDKIAVLKRWYYCKSPNCGVMLIGYEAFRALINYERRKGSVGMRSAKLGLIKEYLLNPGADLVICDEGHQIKNKRSAISEAVSKIKTRRRIMLTGTPIQNNLKEYYCMVNFIKPSFLGSDKEFSNLYANPIKNGQCKDSDQQSIKIMKQRSYVLHNKLSRFVQRKEAAVLKEFLPEKFEYVLFVPLTPVQEKMYEVFLQMNDYTSNDVTGEPGKAKKFNLIADYTSLRKIWTHPKVLEKAWESANLEKNRRDAARKTATPDSDDESPDDHNDIKSGKLSVTNDWWRQYLQTADLESLYPSNKLWILFEILKHCNERGEKVLIFTAFVSVLNMVEHFMAKIHQQDANPQQSDAFAYSAFKGPWEPGKDYYRLDGKTQKSIRHQMITFFNDPQNKHTKCFLISAKAGGQGINLTGANRVIILDTSWNPSNDQQNIFRIFRLGQKRNCYVYRLIAAGTMEEKVYSRSVTKQALSFRVVDEQQIDRHYSYGELGELYNLTKVSEMTRETPILPADDILASLLRTYPNKILKYHEHDSLLENKPEQDLSEEEKKEAWAAYEREIQNNENRSYLSQLNSMGAAAAAAVGGLFGSSAYGSPMAPYYASMGYPGMAGLPGLGGAGDMYRNDYASYGSSMGRPLYMQYGSSQQYSSLMNDPAFATVFAKMYGSFGLHGTGAMDYGMPALPGHSTPMANGGQSTMMPPIGPASSPGGSSGKGYNTTSSLANMLSFLSGKSSASGSGLSPSALSGLSQSMLSGSSSSSLAELAALHTAASNSGSSSSHYNPLKQMSDYAQSSSSLMTPNPVQPPTSSGLTISNITSLHKPNTPTGKPGSSSSSSYDSVAKALFNRLSEQMSASSLATAGVSSPFSPRNVPLLSPTLDSQSRSSTGAAFPLAPSSPMSSNHLSNTIATTTSSSSGASSLVSNPAATLSLSIGQGLPKSTSSVEQPSNLVSNNRAAVESFAENRLLSTPAASSLRSAPVNSSSARNSTTIAPGDDEDISRRGASTVPPKTQWAEPKPNNSTEPSHTNSSGKDSSKATKALNSLAQQLPKSPSPKVLAKQGSMQTTVPTVPPIISSPMPSRIQLSRSNSSTSVSNAVTTTAQQALAKSGAMKPREPSPTFKMTTTSKQPTAVNKPSPLSRSPSTVQTGTVTNNKSPLASLATNNKGPLASPLTTNKGPLPSPATTNVSPTSMRYMLAGAADQRSTGSTIPVTTSPTIGGITITAKPQAATTTGTGSVTQTTSIVTTSSVGKVTKTMAKTPVPLSASAQVKNINHLNALGKQPSLGSLQTSTNRTQLLNTTISPAKQAIAAVVKPKPETRPMTLTMTPIKTPATLSNVGSKLVKNPIAQTMSTPSQPAAVPKQQGPMQPSTPVATNVSTGRTITTSTIRPTNTLQKSGSSTKITPVTLLSTASMTGKLSNPIGTTPRLPAPAASASMQAMVVKTSVGSATTIQQQPQQSVLVSRPNPTISQINRHPAVISRTGKNTMTIAPVATRSLNAGLTITKSNSTNIITPNQAQMSAQVLPRTAGSTGVSPPISTMTVIPTANIIRPVAATASARVSTSPARSTVNYNFKGVNHKDVVIRRAVASPTMRRILPTAQGTQQILINKAVTPAAAAAAGTATLKPGTPTTLSPISTAVKANLPMGNIIRAGAASSNAASTSLTAGVQPTPNSMIIRRRGIDSTVAKNASKSMASHLTALAGTPPIKRPRLEDTKQNLGSTIVTTTPTSTPFVVGNRLSGGLTVATKTVPAKPPTKNKNDTSDVVVLE